MKFSRNIWLAALTLGLFLAAAGVAHVWLSKGRPNTAPQTPAVSRKAAATLNCVFYDLTQASIVVAFDFVATRAKSQPPRFNQRAQASRDGMQKTFNGDEQPVWTYALDEDGKPKITSPDGETRIILYGLKLDTGGEFFIEAGLRSNYYRNLQGQCHQANFDNLDMATASEPSSSGATPAPSQQ